MKKMEELQKAFQKRNFYTIKDTSNIYLFALILPIAIGLIFSYMSIAIVQGTGFIFDEKVGIVEQLCNFTWYVVIASMLTQIVFIAIYLIYHKASRIQFKATSLSFKKANIWTILLCAAIGIMCVLGFVWLIDGCFGELFKMWGLNGSSTSLPLNTVGWYFVNLVILAVLPAICEELLFRGIIFQGLKERFSPVVSVLLTGLLFALLHGSIAQFIYPFILGCVLSVVMHRTNNILYPMVIHLFNNITTITLFFLNEINVINLSFAMSWWFILLAIALAVVTLGLLYVIDRFYLQKHKKLEVEQEGPINQTPPASFGKFPVLLAVGIGVALIFIVINAIG